MRLLFLFLVCFSQAFAATWATIKSKKAIIYSDVYRTSAIGFMRAGKKIRIGSKAKNKGTMYPMVYQGKVVYISKNDIQTSAELEELKSAMDRVSKSSAKKSSYQLLAITPILETVSLSSGASYSSETSKSLLFSGFSVSGHLVKPLKKYAVKLEFTYMFNTKDEETHSLFAIGMFWEYYLMHFKRFKLKSVLGGEYIPHFGYEFGSDFSKNGSGLGFSGGLQLDYSLTKAWDVGLRGLFNYRSLSVNLPEGVSPASYEPTLTGLAFGLAFSYRYE